MDESLGLLDVLLHDGRVGRLIFARAAQADQLDHAVGETLGHFSPLGRAQRRLDAVLVGAAKLDAAETGLLAVLDDRRHVPVFAPVVGHQSKLHDNGPAVCGSYSWAAGMSRLSLLRGASASRGRFSTAVAHEPAQRLSYRDEQRN